MSTRIHLIGLMLGCLLLFLSHAQAATQLPALSWTERSDWVNVKTDVSPAAVGNGIADDTAAIQAALDLMPLYNGANKAVFLPAGTYRITGTLTMKKRIGNLMVGAGRNTRIVWGGASGGIMFRHNGLSRQRFVGMIWDGMDSASVGVSHDPDADSFFETRILYQHVEFRGFTNAAVNVTTPTSGQASAEMLFQNCQFRDNYKGLALNQWNDYDFTLDGCQFLDNAYGVYCTAGNFYIRNCHFERSSQVDIQSPVHSNSVRRCTSVGSRMFYYQPGASGIGTTCIQDCRIDSWTNTTGAIQLGCAGPDTIFDCVFTNPPNTAPPISLNNWSTVIQPLVTSANVSAGTTALVSPGVNAHVTDIPTSSRARGGQLTSASQSFFSDVAPVPGQVFDAKTQFGAVGNGTADDTAAVQNCINAARTAGNGAIAYLPNGTYKITSTLNVTGGNYYLGGSGFFSILNWAGAAGGTVVSVVDPQNVRLEQLRVNAPNDVVCIRQTSAGNSSSLIRYNWVFTTRFGRGFEAANLPEGAVILAEHLEGFIDLNNCSRARVLVNIHYEGPIKVQGSAYAKTGFFGVQTNLALQTNYDTNGLYDLMVKDNQDIVVSDFYCEQGQRHALIEGNGCTVPGRVTIQGAKLQSTHNQNITINDYNGRIFWGKTSFRLDQSTAYNVTHTGTQPLDLLFVGNGFFVTPPTITLGSGARQILLENLYRADPNPVTRMADVLPTGAMNSIGKALDDLEELGALDLSLNYAGVSPRTTQLKLQLAADRGVTKDGSNNVTNWADQSGFANHAFNGGGTECPLLVANTLNGLPVLRFDGVNDNFLLGSKYLFADNTRTGISFVAVVKSAADRTDRLDYLLDFGQGGGGQYNFHYDLNNAGLFTRDATAQNNGSAVDYTHSKGSAYVVYTGIIRFGASSSTGVVRLNGAQVATGTLNGITKLTATEIDEGPTRAWSTGPVSLAMQSKGIDATRCLQGDLAEVLWYDSGFSDTDALEVERYLSKKWGVTLDGTADVLPPAAVSDLAVTGHTDTTVTLGWTAPGDDAAIGAATSYDVRYSTSPITADTWAAATPATGEPTPAATGAAQSLTISGLSAMTTYYFAIKAVDDGGNAAELSNVATVQTLVPQSGLQLWLRADAGVTRDAGDLVPTWADQSGQGFNAFNAGGTERPLYVANALNGYPVLRFDGVNDNFILGSHYLFADQTRTGITFVAVVKSAADRTDRLNHLFDFGSYGAGEYNFHYDLNNAGLFTRDATAGNNGFAVDYTHSKGSAYVVYTGIIRFGTSSSTGIVRLNGAQVATGTLSGITKLTATEIDEAATRSWTAGPVSLAMQAKGIDAARNLQGDIAEILWYDSGFSDPNARALEQYLATKYGITLD